LPVDAGHRRIPRKAFEGRDEGVRGKLLPCGARFARHPVQHFRFRNRGDADGERDNAIKSGPQPRHPAFQQVADLIRIQHVPEEH
jgi:hypothetical protein